MDIYKKGPGCLMISDRGPFALRRLASVCGSCVRIFEHIFACEKGWFCRVRTVSSCVELGFFVCRVWGSSCVEFGLFVCRVAYACCGAWLLAEWRGGCEGWGQQAKSDGLRLPIMRDKGCEG